MGVSFGGTFKQISQSLAPDEPHAGNGLLPLSGSTPGADRKAMWRNRPFAQNAPPAQTRSWWELTMLRRHESRIDQSISCVYLCVDWQYGALRILRANIVCHTGLIAAVGSGHGE